MQYQDLPDKFSFDIPSMYAATKSIPCTRHHIIVPLLLLPAVNTIHYCLRGREKSALLDKLWNKLWLEVERERERNIIQCTCAITTSIVDLHGERDLHPSEIQNYQLHASFHGYKQYLHSQETRHC